MRHFRKLAAAISLPLGALLALGLAAPAGASTLGTEYNDNGTIFLFPALVGTSGEDNICGLGGDDLLYGRGGADSLFGGPGADALYGEAGDDRLSGSIDSRDLLYGGAGHDTYIVGDSSDRVRELAGEGTRDTVIAYVDYVLPANVEKLFLRPPTIHGDFCNGPDLIFDEDCASYTGDLPCRQLGSFAMGNDSNNEIGGNRMDNRLYGLDGDDLLYGYEGDDELEGGSGNDVLVGFAFNGGWASLEDDFLTGEAGADRFVIGLSGRSGGMTLPANQHFPQYLGQGMVYIMDFDWREADLVEVYGDVDDYWVELEDSPTIGPYAAIFWDGSSEGFGARELVGIAVGITDADDLVPTLDFL